MKEAFLRKVTDTDLHAFFDEEGSSSARMMSALRLKVSLSIPCGISYYETYIYDDRRAHIAAR